MVARELRLRSPIEFERVRANGQSWSNRLLVLVALPNTLDHNRYGFAAGRGIGHIVARNRAKRQMREIVRALHPEIIGGYDLIWIARNRIQNGVTVTELEVAARQLLKRANLIQASETSQSRPVS